MDAYWFRLNAKHLHPRLLICGAFAAFSMSVFAWVQPAIAQGDGASTAEIVEETSFAKAFFVSQGSVLGTAIIWFLLLLSVGSFGLMGFLWVNNRRINILPEGLVTESRRLLKARKYRELLGLVQHDESFFSRILSSALRDASHGYGAMARALEQAGEEFTSRRLRQIELLNVIGNVSPMIGLFGTVYGMILTFQGIVTSGGRPDPVELAGGIGTALTTTFWGLVVAIPSLAAYAIIRNNIDAMTSEASLVAGDIVNQFRPTPNGNQPAPSNPKSKSAPATPVSSPITPKPAKSAAGMSTKAPLTSAVASTKRKSASGPPSLKRSADPPSSEDGESTTKDPGEDASS